MSETLSPALHEAAHAVAAVVYGHKFLGVRIHKRNIRMSKRWAEGGRVELVMPNLELHYQQVRGSSDHFVQDLTRSNYRYLVVLFAPAAFARRYCSISYDEAFKREAQGDLAIAHRFLKPAARHVNIDEVIDGALRRADRFVRETKHLLAILNTADRLEKKGRLPYSEVREIVML